MARLDFDILANTSFADGEGIKNFALAHRLAHQQIASAISTQFSAEVDAFDVGDGRAHDAWELLMYRNPHTPPIAKATVDQWLLWHMRITQSEYDAVGLGTAYDLSTADFTNPDSYYTWMQQHQSVHQFIEDTLGIT